LPLSLSGGGPSSFGRPPLEFAALRLRDDLAIVTRFSETVRAPCDQQEYG
jgi:hypothetical protein